MNGDRGAVASPPPPPSVGMGLNDHTTIAILRAGWVLDVLAGLVLNWAALGLLRYLDDHPSAAGSAVEGFPAPGARRWMWRTAGGARVMRFAWSAAAIGAEDRAVRRWASIIRVAMIVIVVSLLGMLAVTLQQPSRHWDLITGVGSPQAIDHGGSAASRP